MSLSDRPLSPIALLAILGQISALPEWLGFTHILVNNSDSCYDTSNIRPSGVRPITRWPDRDEAFQDITTEINRTIKDLLNSLKTVEDWMKVGDSLYGLKRYEEALAAFEQAIRLDPNYVCAYFGKSDALDNLGRFEEAHAAHHQGLIHIDLP